MIRSLWKHTAQFHYSSFIIYIKFWVLYFILYLYQEFSKHWNHCEEVVAVYCMRKFGWYKIQIPSDYCWSRVRKRSSEKIVYLQDLPRKIKNVNENIFVTSVATFTISKIIYIIIRFGNPIANTY